MQAIISLTILCASALLHGSTGLVISRKMMIRMKHLNENFGLDIAESPEENTLREIYGEVNYKNFVGKYEPNGLLLGLPQVEPGIRLQSLEKFSIILPGMFSI
jgi:hypothetical protein